MGYNNNFLLGRGFGVIGDWKRYHKGYHKFQVGLIHGPHGLATYDLGFWFLGGSLPPPLGGQLLPPLGGILPLPLKGPLTPTKKGLPPLLLIGTFRPVVGSPPPSLIRMVYCFVHYMVFQ
jgi:hypothetical protein